jgi:ABC-2 family transporter protein
MIGVLYVAAYAGMVLSVGNMAQGDGAAQRVALLIVSLAHSFQFMVILFGVPMLSAGVIAREKEERTLSLLLVTGLPARDIVLSKFLTAYLPVQLLLLSMLPFTAFAVSLEGVPGTLAAAQFVLLSLTAATLCAVGVLSSTLSGNERTASSLTFLAMILWAAVLGFVDACFRDAGYNIYTSLMRAAMLPPVGRGATTASGSAGAAQASLMVMGPSWGFVSILPALVIALGIAAAALWATAKLLPRQAIEKPEKERKRASRRSVRRRSLRAPRLGPVGELISVLLRSNEARAYMRVLRYFVAVLLAGILFLTMVSSLQLQVLAVVIGFFVASHVCYDASSVVGAVRSAGSLTDVLLLGQRDRTVVRSLFLALFRREAIHLPSLFIVNMSLAALVPRPGIAGAVSSRAIQGFLHGPLLAIPVALLLALGQLALIVSLGCLASIWPGKTGGLVRVTGFLFAVIHLGGVAAMSYALYGPLHLMTRLQSAGVATAVLVVSLLLFAVVSYVVIPRILLWFVAGNFRYRAARTG